MKPVPVELTSKTALENRPDRAAQAEITTKWPLTLTSDDIEALGWQPLPLTSLVLKIHSRCNLACDYCYLCEMADSGWQGQPDVMSAEVAKRTATRLAEHAKTHGLTQTDITLHGGEPLMAGRDTVARILDIFATTLAGVAPPSFQIQTNGFLLTDRMLATLNDFDVRIGVSLDGDRQAHDRHRVRKNDTGSYDVVTRRLKALHDGEFAHLFEKIYATVDLENDPLETYLAVRAYEPPLLDFLLRHGTWDNPPPGKTSHETTPFAAWLIPIFDHWFDSALWEPKIRIFDSIIRGIYGQSTTVESIGLLPITFAVVQTDGSYELVDTLKSTYDGAAITDLNVFDHPLDRLLAQPSILARQQGINGLCPECKQCPEVTVCGGGYYPHRFSADASFLNRSVYCSDLGRLIWHIRERLATWQPAEG